MESYVLSDESITFSHPQHHLQKDTGTLQYFQVLKQSLKYF
jgi:hypothetical protein